MTTKKPGDVIDRYVIDSLLGQGGMGAVYAARDSKLGRHVALKILLPNADTTAHARLLREARTVAAFEHPNAVVMYDVGEAEGAPFLSMELVHGHARPLASPRMPSPIISTQRFRRSPQFHSSFSDFGHYTRFCSDEPPLWGWMGSQFNARANTIS